MILRRAIRQFSSTCWEMEEGTNFVREAVVSGNKRLTSKWWRTVGARLAAKAVYSVRHGYADRADADVLRELTRGLIGRYGETLTVDQVRAEMAHA
jgi:hypothetical protein